MGDRAAGRRCVVGRPRFCRRGLRGRRRVGFWKSWARAIGRKAARKEGDGAAIAATILKVEMGMVVMSCALLNGKSPMELDRELERECGHAKTT